MTEASRDTIRSSGFKTHNLYVIAGFAGENHFFGTIFNEPESCKVKYDDEWISDQDKDELL